MRVITKIEITNWNRDTIDLELHPDDVILGLHDDTANGKPWFIAVETEDKTDPSTEQVIPRRLRVVDPNKGVAGVESLGRYIGRVTIRQGMIEKYVFEVNPPKIPGDRIETEECEDTTETGGHTRPEVVFEQPPHTGKTRALADKRSGDG